MATRPAMAFLRPLPLPRPSTVRFFVRQISEKSSAAKAREDPNLIASLSAPRSYPPPSLKSQPRPKESRSSHRTSQPTRTKNYPDKNPAPLRFQDSRPLPTSQQSPNLPYYVTRTPSNELPVYTLAKGGGNKPLTRVRRVDGDVEALRAALQEHLRLKKADCVVNQLNKHVIVKGHVRNEIEAFLTARNF